MLLVYKWLFGTINDSDIKILNKAINKLNKNNNKIESIKITNQSDSIKLMTTIKVSQACQKIKKIIQNSLILYYWFPA